ncbi:hypothetical protein BIT31_26820 [Klebsiella pneumoniae]|nr:hypothetical protein BIT31_26820 [Klebsiella pneumoniae]
MSRITSKAAERADDNPRPAARSPARPTHAGMIQQLNQVNEQVFQRDRGSTPNVPSAEGLAPGRL